MFLRSASTVGVLLMAGSSLHQGTHGFTSNNPLSLVPTQERKQSRTKIDYAGYTVNEPGSFNNFHVGRMRSDQPNVASWAVDTPRPTATRQQQQQRPANVRAMGSVRMAEPPTTARPTDWQPTARAAAIAPRLKYSAVATPPRPSAATRTHQQSRYETSPRSSVTRTSKPQYEPPARSSSRYETSHAGSSRHESSPARPTSQYQSSPARPQYESPPARSSSRLETSPARATSRYQPPTRTSHQEPIPDRSTGSRYKTVSAETRYHEQFHNSHRPAPIKGGASIAFMLTSENKRVLIEELGYPRRQVQQMNFESARNILADRVRYHARLW